MADNKQHWVQCDDGSVFDVSSAVAVEIDHVHRDTDLFDESKIIPEHWRVEAVTEHETSQTRRRSKTLMTFSSEEEAKDMVTDIYRGLLGVD